MGRVYLKYAVVKTRFKRGVREGESNFDGFWLEDELISQEIKTQILEIEEGVPYDTGSNDLIIYIGSLTTTSVLEVSIDNLGPVNKEEVVGVLLSRFSESFSTTHFKYIIRSIEEILEGTAILPLKEGREASAGIVVMDLNIHESSIKERSGLFIGSQAVGSLELAEDEYNLALNSSWIVREKIFSFDKEEAVVSFDANPYPSGVFTIIQRPRYTPDISPKLEVRIVRANSLNFGRYRSFGTGFTFGGNIQFKVFETLRVDRSAWIKIPVFLFETYLNATIGKGINTFTHHQFKAKTDLWIPTYPVSAYFSSQTPNPLRGRGLI